MEERSAIVLGIRVPPNSFRKVELQTVNLESDVEDIRAEAIRETGLASHQILLVYGGVALEDKNKLSSYGIKPRVMIHVLKKKEKDAPISHKTMTEKEIQQLALAFRTFALSTGFRSTLTRFSRPENLENIVMAIPGLSQDAIALSIIRDPELLINMSDIATIKRALDKHPVLAEAAVYIAAAVHEETITARHSRRSEASAASSSAFSPDVFSGEEMDSSQSSDSPTARSTSSSLGGITSSQLEAALAAAVGSGPSGASTSGGTSRSSGHDRSGFITPEMFNSALRHAFQGITVPPTSGGSSAPTTPRGPPDGALALADRMSQQLQQMRELGLRDQVFNLQALQITNGDVQAAIELVMSSGNNGRDEEDDDDNSFN